MSNSANRQSDRIIEPPDRSRNVFRIATRLALAVIPSVPVYLFLALQSGAWQLLVVAFVVGTLGLLSLLGAFISRRGHAERGVQLIIGAILAALIANSMLIAGFGLVSGLLVISAVVIITAQTLPSRLIPRILIVSSVVCILAGLIDLWKLPSQYNTPGLSDFIVTVAGIWLLGHGAVIMRQLSSYALRTKLILAFFVVTLIPLVVMGHLSNRTTRDILVNEARSELLSLVRQTALSLDTFIKSARDAVRIESTLPDLSNYLMLPVGQRDNSTEEREAAATLQSLASRDSYILSYALLDSEGQNLIDTNVSNIGKDESAQDYFKTSFQTRQSYASSVKIVETSSEIDGYLTFSSPVQSESGQTIGVLRIHYESDILQQLVVRTNDLVGSDSFGVLFDEHYIYLTHGSVPGTIFKPLVPLDAALAKELEAVSRLSLRQGEDSQANTDTNLSALRQGLDNAAVAPVFSAKDVATGSKLNQVAVATLQTQPWKVVFFKPQDVIWTSVEEQTRTSVLLTIVIVSFSIIAAIVVSQVLAGPIIRLTKAAVAVSLGDLDAQVQVETHDEIGMLALAFNDMTAQLSDLISTLEDRVKKRTFDLAASNEQLQSEIAERQRVEDELRWFSRVVEQSASMVMVTDVDGKIDYVNPKFLQIMGYEIEDLRDFNARQLDGQSAEDMAEMLAMLESGGEWQGEFHNRKKNGERFWVYASISPIVNADGTITHHVSIQQDITERKREEVELQQAKEAAEAATQAKSEFLANMSHEIRTPLNAIIGMTGLLLDSPLDSEQRDYAGIVRTSGDALLAVINDILDFSKIESGKLELEHQAFDLHHCVEESLDLLARKAAEKRLELAYIIDEQTPGILLGDVTRLRQILVNLFSNAVKFTETGEVVLSVTSQLLDEKDRRHKLHFAVKDTGIGIPPERANRLFESFSQIDASTTRNYGGTGLGLAISKRLSELMGGTMWIESDGTPGQGSTFHFTIIVKSAPAQGRRISKTLPQLADKRVLIVDDNETHRHILMRQTQSWSMRPRNVASGSKALELLKQGETFDVAILDMHMAEMDGLTLASEIRKHHTGESLPLVMLSSMGNRGGNGTDVQFAAVLLKPVKPSQLYDALIGALTTPVTQTIGQAITIPEPQFDPQMAQRHPLRILVTDDSAINQKVALRILQRLGYRADVASNGLEAIEALERQTYDVVLMDVQMPEMDGLEATRRICKRWPEEKRPRIIAITANALQGDRERCLAAGMDDYISKPLRVEELLKILSNHHPHHHRPDTSTTPMTESAQDSNGQQDFSQHMIFGLPPESTQAAVIDLTMFKKLGVMASEEAPDVVGELIDLYLEDAPALLADIVQSIQDEDAQSLYQASHALKSISSSFGARALVSLCEGLEYLGRAQTVEGSHIPVAQLEIEYEQVRKALEEERRKHYHSLSVKQ